MKKAIIQKITLAHCARGTQTCSKCREMYIRKYCLLDICPDGYAARRVIEVEIDGEKVWREFDIIKGFENYDEAASYARSHNITLVEDTPLEPDPVLKKLEQQLPANWSMGIEHDRLIVKRNEPAYLRFTNLINAPVMVLKKEQQKNEGIAKTEGKEIYCAFVFQLENRWFAERLEWAGKTNRTIAGEIGRLEKKYQVTHSFDRALKSPEYQFRGKSEEEKQRFAAFLKEKKELENKRVRLPDYMSRNYSLFLIEIIGMQDEYTLIYPEEASREMYALEKTFREILDVYR